MLSQTPGVPSSTSASVSSVPVSAEYLKSLQYLLTFYNISTSAGEPRPLRRPCGRLLGARLRVRLAAARHPAPRPAPALSKSR